MWWLPLVVSAIGGGVSQIGANQLAGEKQKAGTKAMMAQLANQDQFRNQALGETIKMSDSYADLPESQQDAADRLYAESKSDLGDDSAQSRLANLKADKSSRASADVRGREVARSNQETKLQDYAAPLTTLFTNARNDWAMTPARMQSAMNKVDSNGLLTLGNLISTGGQLWSLGQGLQASGLFDAAKGPAVTPGMFANDPKWTYLMGRYNL